MKLFNTLTRKKEVFTPIKTGEVKIYACGPTVYNYIHVGNARPLCVFDVLRRFFEYTGTKVTFVQNFTDIDDKIIKKANEEKTSFENISKKYTEEYKKDARGLNIREGDFHPKATETIPEIIGMVGSLIKCGYAYETQGGDVYFSTRSFNEYGKLSHQTVDDLKSGARVELGDVKEDPLDFALWKAAKPGEPFWESPWGNGRPGWHIECSAMVKKYLGDTIDIHCGGQDLIFPHHENEIAQSTCSNGCELANYWIHNGYINVNSTKMSKSLGNFFTVREIAEKYGYEPIRYLMIASHYRSPINFSEDIIKQCVSSLDRLYNFRDNMIFMLENSGESEAYLKINLKDYKQRFIDALNDDLNTADALSIIFDMVRDANSEIKSERTYKSSQIKEIIDLLDELTAILGIMYNKKSAEQNDEIKNLIQKREEARKNKNWVLADEIRNELRARGVIIEDTAQGAKITAV